MTGRIGILAAGALLLAGAGTASAQEAAEGGFASWLSGNVAVTSDYVFRGISQSLEDAAIQGGIDLKHPSGLYLGTWGSSVNFGEPDLSGGGRAATELDVYGGYGLSLAGLLALDLNATYYAYPGAGGGRNYDFVEFGLGATRGLGPVGAGVSLRYSPDFFAGSGSATYYGGSLSVPVSALTLSGALGQQRIEENETFGTPDYLHWSLGAALGWGGFNFGGQLQGTDLEEAECFGGSDLCGSRVVVSISRAL